MTKLAIKSVTPKKPSTAWIFFCTETTKKLKEKNPALTQPERFKKTGEVWSKLSDKQKEKY